jgi:hypothetical protein
VPPGIWTHGIDELLQRSAPDSRPDLGGDRSVFTIRTIRYIANMFGEDGDWLVRHVP